MELVELSVIDQNFRPKDNVTYLVKAGTTGIKVKCFDFWYSTSTPYDTAFVINTNHIVIAPTDSGDGWKMLVPGSSITKIDKISTFAISTQTRTTTVYERQPIGIAHCTM